MKFCTLAEASWLQLLFCQDSTRNFQYPMRAAVNVMHQSKWFAKP